MEVAGISNDKFSILNSFYPKHFIKVANDSMIDLGKDDEIVLRNISTIQAKELLQAKITEARALIEEDKRNKETRQEETQKLLTEL